MKFEMLGHFSVQSENFKITMAASHNQGVRIINRDHDLEILATSLDELIQGLMLYKEHNNQDKKIKIGRNFDENQKGERYL